MSESDSGISAEAWAAYYRWIEEEGANLDKDLAFVMGWHARDEEVARERARAEAAEGRTERIKELSNLERNHLIASIERMGNYHHLDGKLCPICDSAFKDAGSPYPPMPTGPARTAGELLDRLPIINDPAISKAMRDLERGYVELEEATGEASGAQGEDHERL